MRATMPRHSMNTGRAHLREDGFSLLELLVVLALVAVVSALAGMSISSASNKPLMEEAERLAALLDAARAEARGSGVAVRWRPRGSEGFAFDGLPQADRRWPSRWLHEGTQAQVPGAGQLLLGPEPMIGAQQVLLSLAGQRLWVATDGLGPFKVSDGAVPGMAYGGIGRAP